MNIKKIMLLISFLLMAFSFSLAQEKNESDQQISGFSLSGYGEKGKKTWDLSGKTADIFDNEVVLKDLIGNLYGKTEDVKLTAEEGNFDKVSGKIHVERNVVITTSQGARLTTDSLDWDRVNSTVSTNDVVNINKDDMITSAKGARGEPNLSKMNLQKDVKVEINPSQAADKKSAPANMEKIIITCDGPLQVDYGKNVAVFNNNVKVDRGDSQIYSDMMEIYFNTDKKDKPPEQTKVKEEPAAAQNPLMMGGKIDKIICRGNVKTVRGENITYSDEAIYSGVDKKITLTGRPKLIIYSTGEFQGVGQ